MATAQELKSRVDAAMDRDLDRCRVAHGPENWLEHREWVEAYLAASAIEWVMKQARGGKL